MTCKMLEKLQRAENKTTFWQLIYISFKVFDHETIMQTKI